MKGSFTKRGRRCDVTVTKTQLKCVLKANFGPNVSLTIHLDNILAVETQSRGDGGISSIVVHYAAPKKNNKLSWSKLVLSGEPDLCKELKNIFSATLANRLRPKQFLAVINPVSGSKAGSQLFHKKVAPLFSACGYVCRVYETQAKDDYENALKDVNLSELDGLLAVGGDGHYCKLVTAALRKQHAVLGVDVNDPDTELQPLPCAVGVIPAGSGNYLVNYLHGTADLLTAAIKIALGKCCPTNMIGLNQGGQLLHYGGLLCCYGLFGDIMELCERNRWMGNIRYKVLPVRSIFSRRLIPDLHIDLQRESNPSEWSTVTGDYYSVNANAVDLVDNGTKLVPVFGDSALNIHLTSNCPLRHHIKQLSKVAAWTTGAYDYDFNHSERVMRYRIRLPNAATVTSNSGETTLVDKYYINLDGELFLMNRPVCDIRLYSGVVSLFGSLNK